MYKTALSWLKSSQARRKTQAYCFFPRLLLLLNIASRTILKPILSTGYPVPTFSTFSFCFVLSYLPAAVACKRAIPGELHLPLRIWYSLQLVGCLDESFLHPPGECGHQHSQAKQGLVAMYCYCKTSHQLQPARYSVVVDVRHTAV